MIEETGARQEDICPGHTAGGGSPLRVRPLAPGPVLSPSHQPVACLVLLSDLGLCSLQHYASRNGHYAVCQFLLESGANCDAQTHGGATALHRASYCGHTEIARLLLSHGSNPRLVDDDGMTSLHKVCTSLQKHVLCRYKRYSIFTVGNRENETA